MQKARSSSQPVPDLSMKIKTAHEWLVWSWLLYWQECLEIRVCFGIYETSETRETRDSGEASRAESKFCESKYDWLMLGAQGVVKHVSTTDQPFVKWTNLFYKIPVEAVSKSMAMMASPFFSMLLHHRSQWQKPILPRFLDRGLQKRSKLFSFILLLMKNHNCFVFSPYFHILMREKKPPKSEGAHYEVSNLCLVVGF